MWKWAKAGPVDMTLTHVGLFFFTLYKCSLKHIWITYTSLLIVQQSQTARPIHLLGQGVGDLHLERQDSGWLEADTKISCFLNLKSMNIPPGPREGKKVKDKALKKEHKLGGRPALFTSSACRRAWGGWWRLRCHLQSLICHWKSSSLRPSGLPLLSSRGLEPPSCTYEKKATSRDDYRT